MGVSDQKHPKEKEMQEGTVVVWWGFTNSWARKRSKKQRRKENTYPTETRVPEHSKRDKKALNEQCKETEENNRTGKIKDLFKKIEDTKQTFQKRTKKDRNGMDLIAAEDIKRWQEHTEELYKRDLNDRDNHNGVITHLESDILECEVKWALGSISMNKTGGSDGIPAELFQIWKMML